MYTMPTKAAYGEREMKTSPITSADLAASVLSVPPLARTGSGAMDRQANGRIVAHLRSGGVRTFLYGGNANLYHMAPSEFASFAAMLVDLAGEGDWMIPSIGSDFGKALDQVAILKDMPFPTAMLLPQRFPAAPDGVAAGIRALADAYGRPLIAYVKDEGFIDPDDLGDLVADGAVCMVKYAVVREQPEQDAYLEAILRRVDRGLVVSGIGERPAIQHLTRFGLAGFTSGCVCVAPGLSMAVLKAVQRGDIAEAKRIRSLFMPLEDLRDGHSPLRVLHEAVRLAGIAPTGPLQPFLGNLTDQSVLAKIEAAASALLRADREALSPAL